MTPVSATMDRFRNVGRALMGAVCLSALLLTGAARAFGETENLDEAMRRKLRAATASWSFAFLEDGLNHYFWQPEGLIYRDVQTGAEVVRMSTTNGLSNFFHNDLGMSPWSADGRRMAFVSTRDTGAFLKDRIDQNIWFVTDTDGSRERTLINGTTRVYSSLDDYFYWSPQMPDTYYGFGRTFAGAGGLSGNILYKASVTDTDVFTQPLLTFPTTNGATLKLGKSLSPDGRKVVAMTGGSGLEAWYYPATIAPESGAKLDDPDGYTSFRNLDTYWGDTPASFDRMHNQFLVGGGGWIYILPSGSHAWWRLKTTGTGADGGPVHLVDHEPPYEFGEAWPENTGYADKPDPFGCKYWSHFVPDRWGRMSLFSNGDVNPIGAGIWNVQSHAYAVPTYGGGAQHHAWDGFSDWSLTSKGPDAAASYADDRIYLHRYDEPGSMTTVCYTHVMYNNPGNIKQTDDEYASLARPAQSPDGTKVAFHSTFLNPKSGTFDSKPDIYWAVAYYPFPPTGLSADIGAGVKLAWLPPMYTMRGWPYASPNPPKDAKDWPLLDAGGRETGEPIYAREVKKYHVWRSPTGTSNWSEVGTVTAEYASAYAEDPAQFMLHPVAGGRKVSPENKISFSDSPGDGVFHYAVTTEEHSGLESDRLSEVLRVTVSGGQVLESAVVQAAGQRDFWKTLPPAPPGLTVAKQSTPGHYRLSWTEPASSKIRYYNVYYATAGIPEADQRFRIASLPVGTTTWLDWNADPAQPAYYRVTSVDRYGNEGAASSSDLSVPAPPQGLRINP